MDGDDWTNLQEMMGQSDPTSAASRPGSGGTPLPTVVFPFIPTRFVSAAGQLDYAGTAEIAVGADGNPGTTQNFVRIYTESAGEWIHEDVPVGSYGVTSLCIGTLPGRTPAVYAGLRKTGSYGKVVELTKNGTTWQTSNITESMTEDAWVHGMRKSTGGVELLMSLHTPIAADGSLYRYGQDALGMRVGLLDAQATRREIGLVAPIGGNTTSDQVFRRLNSGGVQKTVSYSYPSPSFDEFNDTQIGNTTWIKGGSPLPTESGGYGRAETSWSDGGSANSWMQAELIWPRDSAGLEIRVPYAQHSQVGSSFGGDARISIGSTMIYSSGQNRADTNVDIQVIRGPTKILFRQRINGAAWGVWTSGEPGNTIRFDASGSDVGSSSYRGSVTIQVDWMRFRPAVELLAAGISTSDFSTSEAAYLAAGNTLYLKTATSMNWRDALLYAFGRGGTLSTVGNSTLNTWLQGKFSGEFWTGLYRFANTSPWNWVGAGTLAESTWAAGHPGNGTSDLYAYSNNGQWFSATGNETKPAVYEISGLVPEVSTTVEPELVLTQRLAWGGRSLATGVLHASQPDQLALIQAMIDDKDKTGTANAGDEFVLAERVIGTTGDSFRTLARRSLNSGSGLGYGVTAVRPRGGTSDMVATAEPDGQVCVWLPAVAGGALQRKLLTQDHVGKYWHALDRFAIAGGLEGMAGLRVDPAAPASAQLVIWDANDLGFAVPPIIQDSPPTIRLLSTPSSGPINAPLAARIWDSEGSKTGLLLQFKNPANGTWTSARIASLNGNPPTGGMELSSSPAGVSQSILWNAGYDLGASFRGLVYLRAQAFDYSGSGDWSSQLAYTINGTDSTYDGDSDGMPDRWETDHGLNPIVADAAQDKDGDGRSNLLEFALNMNPAVRDYSIPMRLTIENGYATLTIDRNPDASALVFTPMRSVDRATWQSGSSYFVGIEDTPSRLKVRLNQKVSELPRCFLKLEVSK